MQKSFLTIFAVLASVFLVPAAALANGATPAMTDNELTARYCRDSCHEACESKAAECIRGFDRCYVVCMGGDVHSIAISEGNNKLNVGADDCNAKARAYRTAQKFCNFEPNTGACDEAKALQKEFEDCVKARANGTPQVAGDLHGVKKPAEGGAGDFTRTEPVKKRAEGGAGDDSKSKINSNAPPAN